MSDSASLAVINNNIEPHPALAAIAKVLGTIAAQEWEIVRIWADALLWALARGDSYIQIPRDRIAQLRSCRLLVGSAGMYSPFILTQQQLFLGRVWQLEQDVAGSICQLNRMTSEQLGVSVAEDLQNWFADDASQQQRFAAALALVQHFVLINGGPGTGKTTTVAKILALILKHVWQAPYPPQIALAAPTGKAATHMANALQNALLKLNLSTDVFKPLSALTGQTVHRLLQLHPPLLVSPYNSENPLPIDILVIDESSMLDLSLFKTLLQALKAGVRLILLGDANQLPAVGAGSVLAELSQPTILTPAIANRLESLLPNITKFAVQQDAGIAACVATLTHSYRFDPNKGIGALAAACINCDEQAALSAMDGYVQLQWYQFGWSDLCRQWYQLQHLWWQAVNGAEIHTIFNHLTDIIMLAARKADAQAFNQHYRRYLAGKLGVDTENWFAGMPILVTQNDYDIGLYNGDIGVILVDTDNNEQLAAFFVDGQSYRKIALSRLPHHEPAFAITVHKSQGSEYDTVWLLAPQSPVTHEDSGFNRALLYTALTRARHQFTFCGTSAQMVQAIKNNEQRRSGLRVAVNELMQQQTQMSLF